MAKAAAATKPGAGTGAGGGGAGNDTAELKRQLRPAHEEPVNFAFALGADGRAHLVVNRRKPGPSLAKQIKDEAPDSKNHRWGSVTVNPDDPKLVRFTVNKSSSGMSRKLVAALKGTGYSKVEIVLEDGTAVEAHEEADEQAQDGQAQGAAQAAAEGAAGPEAPQAAPGGDGAAAAAAGQPDTKGLAHTLNELVHQMLEAIRHDPSQKAALVEMATDAQASLKRGDLDQAAAGIDVLRQAIADVASRGGAAAGGAARPATANPGAAGTTPGPVAGANGQAHAGPDHAGKEHASASGAVEHAEAAAAAAKAHAALLATHKRVNDEVQKIHDAMTKVFGEHGIAEEVTAALHEHVAPMRTNLQGLGHTLGELARNTDAAKHAALVQEAHQVIERCKAYVDNEPFIAQLDQNPFAPVSIAKTLDMTFSALSKAIR